MSAAETLIPAAVGLIVGLVPFAYTVQRDHRERRERKKDDERRKLESQRERLTSVAMLYLKTLGFTMALLEDVRVDANNADDLLHHAANAYADLQGLAQGDLLVAFGEPSPAVWADRACRRLLDEALTKARHSRSQGHTGQAARATEAEIKQLTGRDLDYGGPRELVRWSTQEAIIRWPERLTSFEGEGLQSVARMVAERARLELPSELLASENRP